MEDHFTRLVQRVAPKHDAQARAEVVVTRRFLENFSGDQARPSWRAMSLPGCGGHLDGPVRPSLQRW